MRLDAATCVTVVLAIALAAVYNQQIAAHAILVDMLEKRVAFLEKQLIVNDTLSVDGLAVLEALKEMNDAAETRHLRELMSFDHRDSAERYSFKRAKQAGFTFEAVWAVADDHNCHRSGSSQGCLQQLREAGYTEVCTMYLGFTVSDMRASCAPKAGVQRYQPCCTQTEIAGVLRQMKAQSESESFEAARQAGFTAEEMKLAGYTCQDLSASVLDKYASDALLQMRSQSISDGQTGYTGNPSRVWRPRELCSGDELVEMLRKFRDAEGSSDERTLCKHAARAGFSAEELVQAEFTMAEIAQGFIEAHGGVAQLRVDEDGNVLPGLMTLQRLKAAGMTCTQARSAGLRPRHCKQIGYTFREAKEAGYAYFEVHWNRGEETPNVQTNGWEE